jgi:hypothetical protein
MSLGLEDGEVFHVEHFWWISLIMRLSLYDATYNVEISIFVANISTICYLSGNVSHF